MTMPLPEAIIAIWAPFAALFTQPVWCHMQVLWMGTVLCRGPRTTVDPGDRLVSEVRGDLLGRVGDGAPDAVGRKVFPTVSGSTRTARISPRGLGGIAGSTRFHY